MSRWALLAKAHVSAYTRKDGTFVAAHEDSRQKSTESNSKVADAVYEVKPTKQQMRAWELGLKHRKKKGGEEQSFSFLQSLPPDELEFLAHMDSSAPVSRAFYLSAVRGSQMPRRSVGMRFGKAPKGGVSKNHTDDHSELGVSMAKVPGVDYEWYMSNSSRDPYHYAGWLLDPEEFRGSDGEPLMVGLKPITAKEYQDIQAASSSSSTAKSEAYSNYAMLIMPRH